MKILFLKHFSNPSLNAALSLGCFIVEVQNNRKNHLQERALRLVCGDYEFTFGEHLEKDESFIIDYCNI